MSSNWDRYGKELIWKEKNQDKSEFYFSESNLRILFRQNGPENRTYFLKKCCLSSYHIKTPYFRQKNQGILKILHTYIHRLLHEWKGWKVYNACPNATSTTAPHTAMAPRVPYRVVDSIGSCRWKKKKNENLLDLERSLFDLFHTKVFFCAVRHSVQHCTENMSRNVHCSSHLNYRLTDLCYD